MCAPELGGFSTTPSLCSTSTSTSLAPTLTITPPPQMQLQEKHHKAAFFQHIREAYPHLLATTSSTTASSPSTSGDITFTVDSSLHPLQPLGLPAEDIRVLYRFMKAGPQHAQAAQGVHIGAGLSRESRTLVYRSLVAVARRLDSKTKDYKGVS